MRLLIAVCVLTCSCFAQYRPVEDWPRLPQGWNFMETAGVAGDADNHAYLFHRGPPPIIAFAADGTFVRSWGAGVFARPHSIPLDAERHISTTNDGAQPGLEKER